VEYQCQVAGIPLSSNRLYYRPACPWVDVNGDARPSTQEAVDGREAKKTLAARESSGAQPQELFFPYIWCNNQVVDAQAASDSINVGTRVEMAALKRDGGEYPVEMIVPTISFAAANERCGVNRDLTKELGQ